MNKFSLIAALVILAVAVVAAYQLGTQQATEPAPAEETSAAPAATAAGPREPSATTRSPAAPDPNAAFTHFRVGKRNVKAILSDGPIMWVGTSGGVIRYDTRNDEHRLFDNRSGLLANGVFHLSKLHGRLAVGTYGGGLALMKENGEGWDIYNIPEGLADAFVYDVLEAKNGDVWIATWSGANRVRGGELDDPSKWDTFTVKNTDGGLPNDWVYGLAEDEDGVVWMATEGGLARYSGGNWENWNHESGLGAAYQKVRDQISFTRDPAQFSKHHARQKTEMGLEKVDVAYNP
ncbi:MAG: regulator, partial [Gammaproteobacteria bacterium]|nr:regulator [Gammaproteobacteria bacterium]NIR98495.1 regulator [Gammaproteobacteria bacterium]NIT64239.1 regulator [Gammaproteobacteria bacterium]NIV21183.1 regulator [Gammaproteobacteria bacterium]NIX10104.1 regulator [Gammaproteobacteria bacterium]